MARWLETNVAPDSLIAVHDIGAIGYFAQHPRPLLDLAGLVTPEVIPFMTDETRVTRPSGTATVLVADARGKFALRRLPAGQYWVVAMYRGIASPMLAIELRQGERFEAEFTVRQEAPDLSKPDSVAVLPDLEARAVSGRATTFEQRMATGLGIYLTQQEIERRESAGLNDVLRNVPGVRINCGRDGCFPIIARAQPGCVPDYYIGDMRADARMIENLRSIELRGIEVYQGLSQLPKDGKLTVFVELRDVNYPGSKYNLHYDPKSDRLIGTFFQAVEKQTYDIEFMRAK